MKDNVRVIEDEQTIAYLTDKEGLVVFKTKEAAEEANKRWDAFLDKYGPWPKDLKK